MRVIFLILITFQHVAAAELQRDPLEYIQILESAERVRKLQVDRVVDTLNLTQGMRVADLGSGSGLFTRPIARKVGPEGIVYAVDIDPELLNHVQKAAQRERLTNIRTVVAAEYDPRIPEKVDLILICDTLHHIRDRADYLKNLRSYLRPGGSVAIIDFEKNWPDRHHEHRYSAADLEDWMKQSGYHLSGKHDFLEDNFFFVFRTPD